MPGSRQTPFLSEVHDKNDDDGSEPQKYMGALLHLQPGLAIRVIFGCVFLGMRAFSLAADLARDCNQQTNPDLSVRACTALIARNPAISTLHYNRANAYASKGQYKEAIADYAKAIEFDPKQADAHHNIGLARQRSGLISQAIRDYTAALKLNPHYESALFNRGVARAQQGEQRHAIEDFSNAIRLSPKTKTYLHRAAAFERLGDIAAALADYRNALRLDSQLLAARSAIERLTQSSR